jgi:hypothetical protein
MTSLGRTLLWRMQNAGDEARCYLVGEDGGYVLSMEESGACTRELSVDDIGEAVNRCIIWRDELTARGWIALPKEDAASE